MHADAAMDMEKLFGVYGGVIFVLVIVVFVSQTLLPVPALWPRSADQNIANDQTDWLINELSRSNLPKKMITGRCHSTVSQALEDGDHDEATGSMARIPTRLQHVTTCY